MAFFLKKFLKYILFLLFFLILIESLSRLFFSEFNYNNIHYKIDRNHKVIKGIDHFVKSNDEFRNISFRVEKKDNNINFVNNKRKIFFLGDSVTLGFGVKYQDTYFQKLNKKSDKYQILAASNLGVSSKDIFSIIENQLVNYLTEGDTLVYQFNYNDITTKNKIFLKNNNKLEKEKFLDVIVDLTQKIRFKYLTHSTFFKVLQHYAALQTKKIKGNCLERDKFALGMYTFSYFSKSYEDVSEKLWDEFEIKLLQLNEILSKKKIDFYVLISPISLQLANHEKVNKLNLKLECSVKDGRLHLLQILKLNNIKFVDPLIEFQNFEKTNKKILFHEFDTNHPNNLGHKLISDSLQKTFKKIVKE